MPRESVYQAGLRQRIAERFPGCFILKNDPNLCQGIPDLLVLYLDRWAALEVKRSAAEPYQPNQEYYLDLLDEMSYAATIYPENEEEVLHDLQQAFAPRRAARLSKR
jgi:hypothetical protein